MHTATPIVHEQNPHKGQCLCFIQQIYVIEPRSDKRDLLAIKVKSEIITEKERPSCYEQLQKI